MTSERERKETRDAERAENQARDAALTLQAEKARVAALSEDDLKVSSHTAPLVRDEEHSFVQAEPSEFTVEELQPNLTGIGGAGLVVEPPAMIEIKANDIVHKVPLTESRLEIMSDEDIADAGLLEDAPSLIHPARVAPTSERQRTPLQRAPAAGPGSWPVPEDALPAVVPSDPPKEDAETGEPLGDATLSGYPPFKVEGRKVVVYSSEGARSEVEADETTNAAALYLRLRNQFPHFTEAELSDEFVIQWEGRVGAKQSMRPSQELSQHGDTAVGDPRVTEVDLGELRKEATQAQPRSLPPSPPASVTPEAGLPSVNEPATRAPDDEKFGLKDGEGGKPQDAADLEAMALTKEYREAEEEAEQAKRDEAADENEAALEAQRQAGHRPRRRPGRGLGMGPGPLPMPPKPQPEPQREPQRETPQKEPAKNTEQKGPVAPQPTPKKEPK
jgi:hypothetical protein